MKKIVSVAADFRTIYLTGALVLSGLAFAGDLKYMQKEDGPKIVKQLTLQNLYNRVEELEIQLRWETDPVKINVLKTIISTKNNRVKKLLNTK